MRPEPYTPVQRMTGHGTGETRLAVQVRTCASGWQSLIPDRKPNPAPAAQVRNLREQLEEERIAVRLRERLGKP